MSRPDLKLLITLDVLLREGSVTRAAQRMKLSPSAVNRTLARLRAATGDPLLVRAGHHLMPTPRALELRARVGVLAPGGAAAARPARKPDLAQLERTFTLRTSYGFAENFGAALCAAVDRAAPGVRLRFVPKPDKDSTPLREGLVDLEAGVVDAAISPDLRAEVLFRDRFVGVVRKGHALARGQVTAARYAAGRHIGRARREINRGPIEHALGELGLQRKAVVLVGGYTTALALVRDSDLIATVPEHHTGNLRAGLHTFPLPFPVPEVTVSLLWHPRQDADPAHRWLRTLVREVCAK